VGASPPLIGDRLGLGEGGGRGHGIAGQTLHHRLITEELAVVGGLDAAQL